MQLVRRWLGEGRFGARRRMQRPSMFYGVPMLRRCSVPLRAPRGQKVELRVCVRLSVYARVFVFDFFGGGGPYGGPRKRNHNEHSHIHESFFFPSLFLLRDISGDSSRESFEGTPHRH